MTSLLSTSKNGYIDTALRLGIGMAALVDGGDGADRVVGSSGDDTFSGGNGNDQLVGNAGSDSLSGDAGNDALTGGDGEDTLDGGVGNDTASGGSGNDALNGGDGADMINGDDGNDTVFGGADNDSVSGGNGDDLLQGDAGNDVLNGGSGANTLDGGDGIDSLLGGSGNDLLLGGAGKDVLNGGNGANTLDGGTGDDLIKQTVAAAPAAGHDMIDGGDGWDTLTLYLTRARWLDAGIQHDVAAIQQHISGPTSQTDILYAATLKTGVIRVEALSVTVDGVALTAQDDAVAAADDAAGTALGVAPVTVDVLANDSAPDLVRSVTLLDGPAHGSVTLNADNTFTFSHIAADFAYLGQGASDTVSFTYRVTDADGDTADATVRISVSGGVNDAPTDIALSAGAVAGNAAGAILGILAATDPDQGSSLISMASAARFEVADGSVAENAAGAVIGALATTDPDQGDSFTYTVSDDRFEVAAGVLKLKDGVALDFETTPEVALNVTSTDANGLGTSKAFAITVGDVNEAPVVIAPMAAQYATAGTATTFDAGATFADPDAGATLAWSAVSALPSWLGFDAGTHVFTVAGNAAPGMTSVTIQAQDAGGLWVTNTFRVSVSDPTTLSGGVQVATSHADFLDYRGSSAAVNVDARPGDDTVYGSAYNDTITGGTGNNSDQIHGGAGNDRLTSGSATDDDVFWYIEQNSGSDTITDFTRGSDHLGFSAAATGVDSLDDLTIASANNGSRSMVVSWDNDIGQGSITLRSLTGLSASDFAFVA